METGKHVSNDDLIKYEVPSRVKEFLKMVECLAVKNEEFVKKHGDMDTVRGMLIVNFCKYEGSPIHNKYQIWDNLEELNGVKTEKMIIDALQFLFKKATIDSKE